jgi:hypothetical protein
VPHQLSDHDPGRAVWEPHTDRDMLRRVAAAPSLRLASVSRGVYGAAALPCRHGRRRTGPMTGPVNALVRVAMAAASEASELEEREAVP